MCVCVQRSAIAVEIIFSEKFILMAFQFHYNESFAQRIHIHNTVSPNYVYKLERKKSRCTLNRQTYTPIELQRAHTNHKWNIHKCGKKSRSGMLNAKF